MSDYIPNEILIEILARLPVKPLLRFTVVCKSWYALIKNPKFIAIHLKQTTENMEIQGTDKVLLRVYTSTDRKEHYFLCTDDQHPGDEFVEIDFPFQSNYGYFRIVGSCNGLICLCDDYFNDAHTTLVWNPSIRKSVMLPDPHRPPTPHMFALGFGFNPKTNEFKVVRIVYEKEPLSKFRVPPQVQVFSQGAMSWRAVNSPPSSMITSCMVEFLWSQVFLNGAVHWVAYHPPSVENGMYVSLIMMFDMGDEVFKEMSLPPVLAREKPEFLSVASFRGSLAVLCGKNDVWVMKEYGAYESWSKLYTVQVPDVMSRVLGFRRNGEVLLSTADNWFLSYDPETKVISNTGISGSLYSFKVEAYMDTLLLLNGEDV